MDFEKKLAEIIKIEISNLTQDEEFVIKVEVVTDEKDKSRFEPGKCHPAGQAVQGREGVGGNGAGACRPARNRVQSAVGNACGGRSRY